MFTPKDDFKHTITVGAICVYNLSGRIAIGKVVKIAGRLPSRGAFTQPHIVHIKCLAGHWKPRGGISKVKHHNVMVIDIRELTNWIVEHEG